MIMMFAARLVRLLTLAAPLVLTLQIEADAQGQPAPAPRALTYEQQQGKINAWTVGLAAGLIEGAPLRLAAEMARVVDDGDNLHVLPIVTRGPTENVNSLLYLRGIDLAIINSDALEEYRVQFPEIRQHVTYLLSLFPSELHVFVRPEIQSLQDLAGKKVNFNTLGTAAAYSGPLIFSRLGINIEKTFIPHQVALQQMRKGEMAAVVFITSKPVDAFLRGQWEPGFKFLPVTYDSKFEDYYLPAALEAADYPALDQAGRAHLDDLGAHRAGLLQLAGRLRPLPARRPLHRLPLYPARQAAGAWLRPQLEDDQSRRDGPGPHSLSGGAGMAATPGAQAAGQAMKIATICIAFAFASASAGALAQGAGDAMEKLRACSLLAPAERLECLDKLSRDIAPPSPARPAASPAPGVAPAADNWIVSETTSPLDYTPVAIATASSSGGPDGAILQLSIQCRGGRTDLVISGPALTRRGEDYVVSYGVNDGQPVVVAAGTPASGTGVAIRGDVVRLLASLPDRGEISFRVTPRQGAALDGRYDLAGLKIVRDRLAGPCKWPAVAGAPRN